MNKDFCLVHPVYKETYHYGAENGDIVTWTETQWQKHSLVEMECSCEPIIRPHKADLEIGLILHNFVED